MFPRTRSGEKKHRQRKRKLEISLILKAIEEHFEKGASAKGRRLRVLEFGCGDGFQSNHFFGKGTFTFFRMDEISRSGRRTFHPGTRSSEEEPHRPWLI